MKNIKQNFLLFFSIISLAACSSSGGGLIKGNISLYTNDSMFYYSVNQGFNISTYHNSMMGDVPFITFDDVAKIYNKISETSNLSVNHSGNIYSLKRNNNYTLYSFDIEKQTLILSKDLCKGITGDTAKNGNVYDDSFTWTEAFGSVIKSSNKSHYLYEPVDRTIYLEDYEMQVIQQDNTLYVPFHLIELIFESAQRVEFFIYNGKDFFCKNASDTLGASLYNSANGNFIYPFRYVGNDNQLYEFEISMVSKNSQSSEAYRFEGTIDKNRYDLSADINCVLSLYNNSSGKVALYYNGSEVTADGYNHAIDWSKDNTGTRLYVETSFVYNNRTDYQYLIGINTDDAFYLKGNRSKEYAHFDYNYLKMYFENFYGIADGAPRKFDELVNKISLKNKLLSANVKDYEDALAKFLLTGVDDGHTGLYDTSPFTGKSIYDIQKYNQNYYGTRYKGLMNASNTYTSQRKKALSTGGRDYLPYQINGNTAYITFDSFDVRNVFQCIPSYKNTDPNDTSNDTVSLIGSSMYQISQNSSIKNVVFDVTCNGGGAIATLPYLLGIMKKDFSLMLSSRMDYALREFHYELDLNGDGVYGGQGDTYEGKYNFFILTSDFSFSCGTAFPCSAKNNKAATIIGKQSAGGASIVNTNTTPTGFYYHTSSPYDLMYKDLDRNVYRNDDTGIPVDYSIDSSIWYNRTALTQKINQLV